MTTEAMSGTELLKMNDEDFNLVIKEMAIKDLMETISGLQKEMAKEQENFNSLSAELQNIKERNSRQYKQISKDMMASQQRLTLLMNRSMKCFAQQNLHNSNDSPFKRRNSAKGSNAVVTPATSSSNLLRSKSLLVVNHTDLPSSFQSSMNPHLADSETPYQYNVNGPHKPIIISTTANGGVKNNKDTATVKNINDKSSRITQSKLNDGRENESLLVSSSTESKLVNGTNGGNISNSAPVTGAVSGGLYIKRNPSQQQRVTTTANINYSAFLPTTQLPPSPVSESASSTSFPITANPAASSTHASSSRLTTAASTPSFANESRFIRSKPIASQSEYVSPLQMAQARKGVSKSQTFIQDSDSGSQGFRGLPSVKLLAQSFGSNTALNKIPGPSSNSNQNTTFIKTNTGVYRSNSSLNLSDPQKTLTTTQTFISKGSLGVTHGHGSQQEPAMLVNGKPQQMLTKQLNRVPHSSASPILNNEPNELEKTRTKLRSVGREIALETTFGSEHSTVVAPKTHKLTTSMSTKDEENRDERVVENSRAGMYTKKRDNTTGKPSSNVQSASLSQVSIKSINSSSSSSFASSKMTSSAPSTALQNKTLSHTSSIKLSPPNSGVDHSKFVAKQVNETSKNSTSIKIQSAHQPINSLQKQPNRHGFSTDNKNTINTSFASSHRHESGPSERVIPTSAVTIRRAKSREELQQIESDTRTNKDSILKQIQARRKDDETSVDGSNIRTMSNLSRSMPSLLNEGKYFY